MLWIHYMEESITWSWKRATPWPRARTRSWKNPLHGVERDCNATSLLLHKVHYLNPLHGVERKYNICLLLGRSKPRIHYMELKDSIKASVLPLDSTHRRIHYMELKGIILWKGVVTPRALLRNPLHGVERRYITLSATRVLDLATNPLHGVEREALMGEEQ